MKKGAKNLLAVLLALGFCTSAKAAATVTISDGINPLIVVSDNGAGDVMSSLGAVYVRTNVGVWYLSISSAITKPLFGSSTQPVMDLLVQANSSAGGSLTFTFSDSNFGPLPPGSQLTAKADGHLVDGGAPATLTYDVYGDSGNVLGATTSHITTIGPTVMPLYSIATGSVSLSNPFSLTQIIQFSTAGATGFSADGSFSVQPVPEPGFLGLGCLGLVVGGLRILRRKQ